MELPDTAFSTLSAAHLQNGRRELQDRIQMQKTKLKSCHVLVKQSQKNKRIKDKKKKQNSAKSDLWKDGEKMFFFFFFVETEIKSIYIPT